MKFLKFKSNPKTESKSTHYHFNLKFLFLITMVVCCAGLFAVNVGVANAAITGTPPNPTGDTIIDQDTVWYGESDIHCGGDVIVGIETKRINFTISNSHVTADGKWTMGGDTPVNFALLGSTIFFDVTTGTPNWLPSDAIINTNQMIVVESTLDQSKASRIEFRDSTIRGTDYSHLAGGVTIKSGGTKAKHTLIVENVSFNYLGGVPLVDKADYYALDLTGQELASDSSLANIILDYCGRGISLCNNIGVDYVTANGGYVAFINGKDWNHLTMHKTVEGLYNPADGAWIRNSWFDAGDTKFNIMMASDVVFEYNTLVDAHFNAGAGTYEWEGNNNILQHNTFIETGMGSVKTGLKIIDNTLQESYIVLSGTNGLVAENTIEGISWEPAIRLKPHVEISDRSGGHVIRDNTITNQNAGIYLEKQDNITITSNLIDTATNVYGFDGYGIKIANCADLLFRDNSITNTDTFDIAFGGWERGLYGSDLGPSSNVKFINTKFDESKVHFVNAEDVFNNYYYLNVKVEDSSGIPIQGATVSIANDVDGNYPSININGETKTSFTTGANGHTPLPSDLANSASILDFKQNSATKTEMSYTITVSKDGNSNSTIVSPDSSWYRSDPNIHQNTITLVLDTGPDTTPPTITSHSPLGIDVAINTNISTTFSEAMNQSSAQNAFSISPNITGLFSWNSNQMIFNPSSDLSNNTTYTITISTLAEDSAGNNLQSQYTWDFTTVAETPPDTTPPIRSDGSPTGTLSYGTTSTILSLTTDENATCKYGTITGVSYESLPNTFSTTGSLSHSQTISGLTDGQNYTYYIKCQDTIGNSNTDDYLISFSVNSEPQTGELVAHWKFDEDTGEIAYDSSGNNNDGTLINNPIWIDGKIGNALEFDGTDDYVNCGNSATLNPSEVSYEAWIKRSASGKILFMCNAAVSIARGISVSAQGSLGYHWQSSGSDYRKYNSPTNEITVNNWFHVVVTQNGTNAPNMYINGISKSVTLVSSAGSDALPSAQTWSIGQYGVYPDYYWTGTIDEVRIYNRALTAEEVLEHYNEGNTPQINHDPIGTLDTADQTSITGWAYDANAGSNPIDVHIYIDGINVGSSTANQSRPDIMNAGDGQVQDPNHGFTFSTPTDLSIGEHTVSVYAINQPEGTNPELNGSPKTFTVSSSDTTPPTGSIQINSGNEKTNSQNVSLTISANDPSGLSEMKISNSNDFNSVVAETYSTIKTFILSTGDGLKTVYIWFKDTVGNWTNQNNPETDTIILDTAGPTISNISVSNITTNTALISFQTNEPSTSHIEYGLTSSYGSASALDSALATIHSISLSGLSADTTYHFKIISRDALENESNSIDQTFKTIGNPDTIPPAKITDLSSSNITQTSADLNWTSPGDDHNTGTASTYDIRYSTSNITESNWNSATQISGEPIPQSAGTEQSIYIAVGLSSNTTYYFAIKTSDEVPNWSDYSNILSLKTLAVSIPPPPSSGGGTVSDTTPPSQPINFTATPADSQIFLTWTNPTDSDFVRVTILRISADPTLILTQKNAEELFKGCPLNCQNQNIVVVYEGTNQQYTDINLNNNTTYYYSIFAYDKKPNYSKILTISTKPEKGITSIEISNGLTYPESTLLKTPDSFKIYIIINQKKKWIPTPEVFETLGYQWTEIIEIDKNELTLIPDYEDNLIRAINDFKVYLIVNGIKRHIPNPEIFLNYGFEWNEVKDVSQETINQYTQANLIKESKKEEIYYLCPERKIKRWLRSPEIFNSYPDNNWNNIQVISKYEMDHYPESNLIQLIGDNNVYLIENNRKRLINSVEEFEREGLDWGKVMGVGGVEWEWFK